MFNLKVDQFARQHQLFKQHATILIAVSGGPDSMALLHYLKGIQHHWGFHLVALTVDHSLRGAASEEDVKFVTSVCDDLGVACESVTLDVPSYKEQHQVGTQVAARHMRYQFFAEQMQKHQADMLAMGHHGDDQVETVFMRMARGAEPQHMKGMDVRRPFGGGQIIRPFLGVTKAEIEEYCQKHDIHYCVDASNASPAYTRNAFRLHVLPFLKEQNRKVHEHIQAYSEYVSEDEAFLKEQTDRFFQSSLFHKEPEEIRFDLNAFLAASSSLQRRTFHLILNYLYQEQPDDVTYHHWEQFKQIMKAESPHLSINLPRNLMVLRSYEQITFTFLREDKDSEPFHFYLNVPGKVLLPDGTSVHASWDGPSLEQNEHHFMCDVNKIALPLHVRTRRAGDRIALRGMDGHKKIKDLFIDHKVPQKERDSWPMVTDHNGRILWVVSLQKARLEAGDSIDWLHLTVKNDDTSRRMGNA
ncbi:tRNA lysidine(34) synthetase TilS [Pontibacillus salicampi]|uniref:tRNA(Ile)-lysidine synthase n=1 Tax=Pontibacillus salicampi TaxID=1449801 RepID=A0ABV6LT97_9BACI